MPRALEVVENLVGGAGRGECCHLVRVEVADAPGADLALLDQAFEGGDGFGDGDAAGPVEEVEVEIVGAQAAEAAFAGLREGAGAGVLGIGLADKGDFGAAAGDGLGDDFLGAAIGVHFGGVDEGEAEV